MDWVLGTIIAVIGSASPVSDKGLPTARSSITLRLHASPNRAFPMFDPVNESLWAPDWRPTLLGDRRVASGLVFTTEDEHGRAAWLLDRYDPDSHIIRYINVRPTILTTIDITVMQDAGTSIATVTYTRTALDPRGVDGVRSFAEHFENQGPHWENAINAALDAGKATRTSSPEPQ